MSNKLAIGTVQFGMDYGINNSSGKIPLEEIKSILTYCQQNNIKTIDTAQAYGNSEKEIGTALIGNSDKFKIITKLSPQNVGRLRDSFFTSIKNLNTDSLYAFMYHNFESFKANKSSIHELLQLKEKGLIKKIGFSLYFPSELEYLFNNNTEVDLIQIPYNLFDRRFEYYFEEIKKRNIEIHVRSVFLQGLFFIKPENLKSHFESVREKIKEINNLTNRINITTEALCLNFAVINEKIDKVVVGIDGLKNIKDNIASLEEVEKVKPVLSELKYLSEENEKILLPFKWKI